MDEKKPVLSCIDCHIKQCRKGTAQDDGYPDFCLTTHVSQETQAKAMDFLLGEDNALAVASAQVESEGYCRRTRVEEVMQFAHKIGAKKLGIATCIGLLEESRILAKILRLNGFEVYGVACKIGANKKTVLGLVEGDGVAGSNMCNPVLQALALNDAKTDLNLIMGLCVGHDSLFIKHSDALVTSVVTKDRVLGHNPCVALYQASAYYKKLLDPQDFADTEK